MGFYPTAPFLIHGSYESMWCHEGTYVNTLTLSFYFSQPSANQPSMTGSREEAIDS